MGKLLRCTDLLGCDAVVYGKDEDEVMRKAEDHVRTTHNMTIIPPAIVRDIVDHITDGEEPPRRWWWRRSAA